jgi:hypothetical protein
LTISVKLESNQDRQLITYKNSIPHRLTILKYSYMKTIFLNITILVLLSTSTIFSQTSSVNDSLLDHMVGKWILQGKIAGQETIHDINVEWVLGHQYLQVREVSRERDADGSPSYDAIVFITLEQTQNQYKCLWLDNTGNGGLSAQAIGLSPRNADNLEFVFRISDSSTFNTTFLYDKNSDSWQWKMESRENNTIQPFALVSLTRVK